MCLLRVVRHTVLVGLDSGYGAPLRSYYPFPLPHIKPVVASRSTESQLLYSAMLPQFAVFGDDDDDDDVVAIIAAAVGWKINNIFFLRFPHPSDIICSGIPPCRSPFVTGSSRIWLVIRWTLLVQSILMNQRTERFGTFPILECFTTTATPSNGWSIMGGGGAAAWPSKWVAKKQTFVSKCGWKLSTGRLSLWKLATDRQTTNTSTRRPMAHAPSGVVVLVRTVAVVDGGAYAQAGKLIKGNFYVSRPNQSTFTGGSWLANKQQHFASGVCHLSDENGTTGANECVTMENMKIGSGWMRIGTVPIIHWSDLLSGNFLRYPEQWWNDEAGAINSTCGIIWTCGMKYATCLI